MLWDAGTEVNQEPGSGADQPLHGGGTSGDADPDNSVRLATDDFGNLPAVSDVIKVTLHQNSPSPTLMRLTIENVSTATTLMTADGMSHPTPLAPGVYVVHSGPNPLFTEGEPDTLEGDITDMLMLWDAGTEPNEKPGYGIYQAPRQSGPNMGPTEGGLVNLLDPCYAYPELGDVLRVTVTKIAG